MISCYNNSILNMGVIMGNQYDIVEVVEDIAKLGYSVSVFGAKLFYGVSNLENLKKAMNVFVAERFSQRLEYFVYEHDNLVKRVKEDFYNDLKNNSQNLNYLYEFIEKTRTTAYDIHAKLLARLSVNLIQNGKLNYLEESLLLNLNILTNDDILKIHRELKSCDIIKKRYKFQILTHKDYYLYQKCQQLGIFTHYTKPAISVANGNQSVALAEQVIKDKEFLINEYTNDFFQVLDEISED